MLFGVKLQKCARKFETILAKIESTLGQQLAALNHNLWLLDVLHKLVVALVVPGTMQVVEAEVVLVAGAGAGAGGGPDANNVEDDVIPFNATLWRLPQTLYDLWNEYDVGIARCKAAKDFTAEECGRVKYTYHRG